MGRTLLRVGGALAVAAGIGLSLQACGGDIVTEQRSAGRAGSGGYTGSGTTSTGGSGGYNDYGAGSWNFDALPTGGTGGTGAGPGMGGHPGGHPRDAAVDAPIGNPMFPDGGILPPDAG